MIKGNKEKQQQINDLAAQVAALQNGNKPVNNQNINPQQKTGAIDVKLTDNATVVLEQNNPNP